jgi:phage-related protein
MIVSGVFSGIIGIIKVWWYGGILAIFRRAGAFLVKGLWVGLWNGLRAAPGAAFRLINKVISNALKFLAGIFVRGVRGYFTVWRNVFTSIRQVVGNAMIAARTRVGAILAGIGKLFTTGLRVIIGVVRTVFRGYVTVIREGLTRGVGLFRSLPGRIARALAGLAGRMLKIGNGIIQALIEGIKNKIKDVGGAMKAVGDKIAGFLPGSPVKEGPLTVLNNGRAGGQIATMLAGGMTKGTGAVARASGLMAGAARIGPRADLRRPGGGGGGLSVTVHNPLAERASDSVPRAIQRATRQAGWAAA